MTRTYLSLCAAITLTILGTAAAPGSAQAEPHSYMLICNGGGNMRATLGGNCDHPACLHLRGRRQASRGPENAPGSPRHPFRTSPAFWPCGMTVTVRNTCSEGCSVAGASLSTPTMIRRAA